MKKTRYLKVALVGATCTGKTSIIEYLRNKYKKNPRIVFVEEGARAYFAANPEITDRGAWEVQTGIRDWVLRNEIVAGKKSPTVMICDRSIIDSAVYMEAHGDAKGAQKLFKSVIKWVFTYDKILMLDPADVPYIEDDIRTEGLEFRHHVHKTFVNFFNRNKIEYEVVNGTLYQRIKFVESLFISMI